MARRAVQASARGNDAIPSNYVDNAFRTTVLLLSFRYLHQGEDNAVASLTSALFLLPYALLSLWAGVAADRFSKRTVIVIVKGMEIPLLFIGLAGLFFVNETDRWPFTLCWRCSRAWGS
ncbi:MAG: hypothetical protein U1D30_00790 [Planctomycetota bacterium]